MLAGCQPNSVPAATPRNPFPNTGQPAPEAPQFRNGKPSVTGEEEIPANPAAGATAAQPRNKAVAKTASRSAPTRPLQAANVTDVVIDMTNADKGFGWAFTIDKARAAQIADPVVTARFEKIDNDKGRPVVLTIHFNMLYLANTGSAIALGSHKSHNSAARVTYDVRDRNTNQVALAGGRTSAAGSRRFGGLISAGQIQSQDGEMALVAQGIANALEKALFRM